MEVNETAPDFELPDLENRPHRLSDLRGRLVVVNFWSCECPQSERTDPLLKDLASDEEGASVLLSIASNRNESPEAISLYWAKEAIRTRCYRDGFNLLASGWWMILLAVIRRGLAVVVGRKPTECLQLDQE